ncbi:MAG: DUF1295 domain-containing protein [Bacilli bacterium]|nr:DUF1295 domain-containing protein [Bacilli bacterium]
MKSRKEKIVGLLALLLVYLVALTAAFFLFRLLDGKVPVLVNVLLCDIAATLIVWLSGIFLGTASVYDPYWSVQTFFIYLGLLIYYGNWNLFTIVVLITLALYSIRLTGNFIMGFHSLSYVDWRYEMLREKSGCFFQLVNLFGICMFPTLVVYSASLPLFVYASLDHFTYWDFVGILVILFGVGLELVSDLQMKSFLKHRASREEVIDIGLWRYSRHPNYLGEILIWFGAYLVLFASHPGYWYLAFGAIINLLMFLFISIPMEEKHMKAYKSALNEYIETTSVLLLLPRKKKD